MKITSHICSVVICMELCLTLSYEGFTYFKRYSIFCMNLFYLILPLPASASLQLWSCNAELECGNIGVFLAESVRWEGLVLEVDKLFSWLLLEGGTYFGILC